MKTLSRSALCIALASMLVLPPALAQEAAEAAAAPAASAFSKEQLEQLAAPVALYPDSVLMQLLMAATYPLEVVQAQRWLAKNGSLKGKALEDALKEQDWDPSVKSLVGFPEVLKQMGDNLDWTQDLGDAFLGQEDALLDAVQVLRGKAYESGNLESTEQIVVTQEPDKIIVIEPTNPEVIYVPTYSPTVVYGGWGYSSWYYPSMYYPPAPGYWMLAFGVGVAWGAAMWGDCNWGWGGSDVDIDIDRQNNFNRNTNINGGDRVSNRPAGSKGGKQAWQHDASHRKGVNYKDGRTASKYGGSGGSSRVSADQARGRTGGSAATRPSTGAGTRPGAGGGAGARPSTGALNLPSSGAGGATRPSGGASTRPSTGASTRPSTGASTRPSGSATRPSSTRPSTSGGSAYSGSRGSSSSTRSASSRGSSSRSMSSGGGASRGGGGGSRGGGGGRR